MSEASSLARHLLPEVTESPVALITRLIGKYSDRWDINRINLIILIKIVDLLRNGEMT